MITGTVKGQQLQLKQPPIVADTIDYLEIQFRFSSEWDHLIKWVHLSQGETVYDIRLDMDMVRREDHMNLSSGEWKVYLHGNELKNGRVLERITTNCAYLHVSSCGPLKEGQPLPRLPASAAEQIAAQAEQAARDAAEALDAAEQTGPLAKQAVQAAQKAEDSQIAAESSAAAAARSEKEADFAGKQASAAAEEAVFRAKAADQAARSAQARSDHANAAADRAETARRTAEEAANTAEQRAKLQIRDKEIAAERVWSSEMVSRLAMKPTASGAVITVEDSLELPLAGLRIFGKTVQNGTPSPEQPAPILSVGAGGTVETTVCGANLLYLEKAFDAPAYYSVRGQTVEILKQDLRDGTAGQPYSCCVPLVKGRTYVVKADQEFGMQLTNETGSYQKELMDRTGIKTFVSAYTGLAAVKLFCPEGAALPYAVSNLSILTDGAAEQPFLGQTLVIPTPQGLCGIPVSMNGNYTDPTGKQWLLDEIDLEKGVCVKRLKTATLDANRKGWNQNPYNSDTLAEFALNGIGGANSPHAGGYCNYLNSTNNTGEERINFSWNSAFIRIRKDRLKSANLEGFLLWLKDHPLQCIFPAKVIETNPLSPEVLEAYGQLHTLDHHSTIFTRGNPVQRLTYFADPTQRLQAMSDRLAALENHAEPLA